MEIEKLETELELNICFRDMLIAYQKFIKTVDNETLKDRFNDQIDELLKLKYTAEKDGDLFLMKLGISVSRSLINIFS